MILLSCSHATSPLTTVGHLHGNETISCDEINQILGSQIKYCLVLNCDNGQMGMANVSQNPFKHIGYIMNVGNDYCLSVHNMASYMYNT